MCGIGGVVRRHAQGDVDPCALRRMARSLRHRGPDGWGLAVGDGVGLVATRLAVVDVPHGWQPLQSPAGSVLVYNGEVYNAPELRADLMRSGLTFTSRSDTEVVLRLLEHEGLAGLDRCNGQFALAWWEPERRRLTLARDRFGVRPLHWSLDDEGSLVFGSEVTALLVSGEVLPGLDLLGLDDVFSTWGARAPRSVFTGVRQVRPGGVVVWEHGQVVADRTWWEPDLEPDGPPAEDLEELLRDSVRLRLRADIRVGTYLSGGLDSSLVTALAVDASRHELSTFSLAFDDPRYDESEAQRAMAAHLGTRHTVVQVGPDDVADAFADAVRCAGTPLVRSAPAPMALLARATRAAGTTVVLTGEGADELFWGYDVFKEVAIRTAAVDDPEALAGLDALYPHLGAARGAAWRHAFSRAGPADDPLFSHQPRIQATRALTGMYRAEVAAAQADHSPDRLRRELPAAYSSWPPLQRACWLELHTLLEPYLLAAQGDRMAMAHGVEGRYPFLDHRVFEHAARLPARRKLSGQRDKAALRDVADRVLPAAVAARRKQPYRAPEVTPFLGRPWVEALLSPSALREVGVFDERRVAALLRRCEIGTTVAQRPAMALLGVLSTQLWAEHFLRPGWAQEPEETSQPQVHLQLGSTRPVEGVA